MWVFESARDHGIADDDACYVAENPVVVLLMREDPPAEMRLGYDKSGRALEVGVELRPHGWVLFHANKMTKAYEKLMKEAL